jgi:hypothetical protein
VYTFEATLTHNIYIYTLAKGKAGDVQQAPWEVLVKAAGSEERAK